MAEKIFAVVGSFAMKLSSAKGIHVFSYEPETAAFTHIGDYRTEINVGQRTYNKEKDILYITHEAKARDGEMGGGGKLLSMRLNHETGVPEFVNEQYTCFTSPSYILLEQSGNYLLVPNHGTDQVVTRVRRGADGKMSMYTECDDCAVSAFPLKEDGSIGEISDVCRVAELRDGEKLKKIPHLHNCIQSLDGKLIVACDKGLDMIHTFQFDPEKGKLLPLKDIPVKDGTHPRYGIFHPTQPILYTNCENRAYLHVWKYDSETGNLVDIREISLLQDEKRASEWTKEGASDLTMTPDGKFLYASVRGLNVLSAFEIAEDGSVILLQDLDCGGENPRGICLSPDGRFLFSMNRDTNNIARFKRGEDGRLLPAGAETGCDLPGNMIFLSYSDGCVCQADISR